jgi:3-oxoacyl-ACP reductase-like protein
MSLFGSIMQKIFHHGSAAQPAPTAPQPAAAAAAPAATTAPAAPADTPVSPTTPAQAVDVEAVLTQIAQQKGGGGNWQSSIVDLLKMLDLDSSLSARAGLADELNVHAGENGSAEENIALHKAVMQKLAENGGKVPASMTD